MNKSVRQQYETFPYPAEVNDLDEYLKTYSPLSDHGKFWERIFPEREKQPLNVLVAGCGTFEAALRAYLNPESIYFGIDISAKSIQANRKLIKKHNIKNLVLVRADFVGIDKTWKTSKFDLIHCNGVIHHLKNPSDALKTLKNLLNLGGAINLMVYGSKQLHALNEVKKVFKKFKLKQDKDSIYSAEALLHCLSSEHPAKRYFAKSSEMSLAEKVDLLLHSQEQFFDVKDILDLLKQNGLYIKNFITPNINRYSEELLRMDQFKRLSVEEQLEIGQILNWNDDQIEMILCTNKKHSLVYNKNYDSYYVHAKGSAIEIDDDLHTVSFINENVKYKKLDFVFKVLNKDVFLAYFTGRITGREFYEMLTEQQVSQIKAFVSKLYEHGYVDFSKHKER